jgi:hypothetical protein
MGEARTAGGAEGAGVLAVIGAVTVGLFTALVEAAAVGLLAEGLLQPASKAQNRAKDVIEERG